MSQAPTPTETAAETAREPIAMLCRYRVKPGHETQFEGLLADHWQMLHGAGLTTDDPARVERLRDQAGNVAYAERFSWRDEAAIASAHESPEVMRRWEPMGALCEDMEFWHVDGRTG